MYLSHLSIENVKSFGTAPTGLAIPAEPGWYVFAGRNGSGKSTLLRAVALALAGPDFARQLVPSFARWIREGEDLATAQVYVFQDPGRDKLSGNGKAPKNGYWAGLQWERHERGPEPALTPTVQRRKQLSGPWRGPWSDNPQGWMVVGYGPFRRLTGHAAEAQRAMVGPHHVRRLVNLFSEDASLKEVVEWLKALHTRALERRPGAEELLVDVMAMLNDDLLPDGARVHHVDSDGLWVARDGVSVELHSLSDGYRIVIALVLDLIRHMADSYGDVSIRPIAGHWAVDMPGVVLIDEADAHLHVSWQQKIGPWLRERFPRVQFLVTTHSPFVCQAASEGGLFRLPAPGEDRFVEPVSDETFRSVVNGTVDDAVLSDLFGMDRTDSPRAHQLKVEYSKLEAKRLRRNLAPTEMRRLKELKRQLPLPFEPTAAE